MSPLLFNRIGAPGPFFLLGVLTVIFPVLPYLEIPVDMLTDPEDFVQEYPDDMLTLPEPWCPLPLPNRTAPESLEFEDPE
jgi:hypothetical protein